jgi:hypothetical protein
MRNFNCTWTIYQSVAETLSCRTRICIQGFFPLGWLPTEPNEYCLSVLVTWGKGTYLVLPTRTMGPAARIRHGRHSLHSWTVTYGGSSLLPSVSYSITDRLQYYNWIRCFVWVWSLDSYPKDVWPTLRVFQDNALSAAFEPKRRRGHNRWEVKNSRWQHNNL